MLLISLALHATASLPQDLGNASSIWLPRTSSHRPASSAANQFTDAEWALFRMSVPIPATTHLVDLTVAVTAAQTNEKLLGAYKLWVNDMPLANGPGRNVHCSRWANASDSSYGCAQVSQGYDVVNATSAALAGVHMESSSVIIVALQCFNQHAKNAGVLASVVSTYADGSSVRFDTATGDASPWRAFNASAAFGKLGWNQTTGPATEGGMYTTPRENLDHRFWPVGWRSASFIENSAWVPPGDGNTRLATSVPLHPKSATPIAQFNIPAVNVTAVSVNGTHVKGRYLVDLGSEIQGGLTLRVPAVAVRDGGVIEVRLAEALLSNGSAQFHTSAGPQYVEMWTTGRLKGTDLQQGPLADTDGDNIFDFGHEYKEFRWAEILGWPVDKAGPLTPACVGAWVVRYAIGGRNVRPESHGSTLLTTHPPPTPHPTFALPSQWPPLLPGGSSKWATFASSNSDLDEVFKFTRNTIATTSLDVNTDSNTRQRDNCMIDAFVAAMGQFTLTGEVELPRRTLEFALLRGFGVHPGWTEDKLVVVFGALQLLRYDAAAGAGDPAHSSTLRLLNESYGTLAALSFDKYFVAQEALVVKGCPAWEKGMCGPEGATCASCEPDLVDYPSQYTDGFLSPHNRSVVTNSYLVSVLAALSEIATALGKDADAAMWSARSAAVRAALLSPTFVNTTSGLFLDGAGANHSALPSQFFPPCHGVYPSASEDAAAERGDEDAAVTPSVVAMLDRIENKTSAARGTEPACSCFGAHWLLQGLYHIGRTVPGRQGERAAEMALRFMTSEYTWLEMLRQGATATMEVWTRRDKPNLSWSHPWCSAPGNAIPRFLLGVAPTAAGWRTYLIRPQLGSLTHAAGTLCTPIGDLAVRIEQRTSSSVTMTLDLPVRGAATVCLPPPPSHGTPSGRGGGGAAVVWEMTLDGKAAKRVLKGRLHCVAAAIEGGGAHIVTLSAGTESS